MLHITRQQLGRLVLGVSLTLGALSPAVWVQAQVTAPAAPPAEQPEAELSEPASDAEPAGEERPPSLSLVRKGKDDKDREILIQRTSASAETGVFALCGPQEDEPENAPSVAVFSETGPEGVSITIDKNVIRVPLAVVTQRTRENGEAGDGRVEASAGTARFLDEVPEGAKERLARCAVEVSPKPAPDTVFVTQGKTQLRGQKLVYDESNGIARVDGPITFSRENGDDSLSGKSDRIDVDVDEEKTVLIGNVELRSKGGRVSKAARVEYDDTANLARLYGTPEQPAESVLGKDVFRAGVILYYLDRNEVYSVKPEGGTITGEFQDGESSPAAPTTPSTP
ncbi:LptA/OstA family protein [Deinococcus enclensis]|uniref:Organic solvent tolerance-like N-terminal domain-containing protein n=1 Tax=Deinococcus enclensis TaxID=1049582 RepID=A0ABT9MH99_9DEIO|nr:LptA/OstA family protein [Deinococcus enclensis]MDP9765836.1 hypothetical protein [Deinococcus enclensis]